MQCHMYKQVTVTKHKQKFALDIDDIDSDIQRICNSLNYNIISPCSLPCHIIDIALPRLFKVAFYIELRVMQKLLNS